MLTSTQIYADAACEVHQTVVGSFDNNVYIVRCRRTGDAVLVDAADEHDFLLELSRQLGVRRVLETHGHWDHIQAVPAMREAGIEVAVTAADERAKAGMFLAFQHPESISGVSVTQFLRQAMAARRDLDELSVLEVRLEMGDWMSKLRMDPSFAERHLNEGFSGGERKRNEILQMALLDPALAILDETDSGLDIDALKIVADGVAAVRQHRPELGVLVVTHYQRLLSELKPEFVHVLVDGRIVESGGPELAAEIETDGYDRWRS